MNEENRPDGMQPDNQGRTPFFRGPYKLIIWIFIITLLFNVIMTSQLLSGNTELEYSQFVKLVEADMVAKVQMEDDELAFELKEDVDINQLATILGMEQSADAPAVDPRLEERVQQRQLTTVYTVGRVDDPGLAEMLKQHDVRFFKKIVHSSPILDFIFSWIVPILLMYGMFALLSRTMSKRMGGGSGGMGSMMGIGKSKAKVYDMEKKTGITFADVAGQDEAKESLMEMVDYLHNPKKYEAIGAKQPKGALLVGPPGTGKTLLAKAVAGEANVPFFSLSGSEFVEMFVGVGASRVRDLFEQAKKQAPCIIFIDEIDAIGKSRDNQMGSNDEREQTLNQLLAEMDGFDGNSGVVILAATNRPEVLDKALLRPGRFDRRVIVEKPDLPGREAILKVHAAKVKLGSDVNLREIALATSGAAGADLANMINEAALRAVRMGRDEVNQQDLMESVEVVIAGKEKKDRVMNKTERRMVAYHEVGHALVAALQSNSMPVQKITIVPRTMGSLGYTMQLPEEERYLMTKSELLAQITTLLGGRTAEEIAFGESSTGASNDIERATQLARSMVTQYGMSDKFDMMGLESTQNKYLDGRNVLTCSEATGREIDQEVNGIIKSAHQRANELISGQLPALDRISEYLLEKESISGEEFMNLLKESGEE